MENDSFYVRQNQTSERSALLGGCISRWTIHKNSQDRGSGNLLAARQKTGSNISFSIRSRLSGFRPTCYWLHGVTALECSAAEAHGQRTADHPFSRKLRLMPQQRTEEFISDRIRKIWVQPSRTGIYFRSPLLVGACTWVISVQFPNKCNDSVDAWLVSCGCYTHDQGPMIERLFL